MNIKICPKCKIKKTKNCYSRSKTRKDGLQCYCKECSSIKNKEWYSIHKDKHSQNNKIWHLKNKDKVKKRGKKYRKNNKNKIQEKSKKYYENNKEIIRKKRKKYYVKNKKKIIQYIQEYRKKRYKTDMNFKMDDLLRNSVRRALKGESKSKRTMEIIGCSTEDFWKYLESKFTDGMTRKNHGKWHIDHIIPISSAKTLEEKIKLSHYTNLQPLWAKDNLKKSNKFNINY
jgi:hypothetical protein